MTKEPMAQIVTPIEFAPGIPCSPRARQALFGLANRQYYRTRAIPLRNSLIWHQSLKDTKNSPVIMDGKLDVKTMSISCVKTCGAGLMHGFMRWESLIGRMHCLSG